MKNIYVLLILSFLLMSTCVQAEASMQEAGEIIGDKLSDVSQNTGKYAEIVGENLLKFQEFLVGSLSFLSFGIIGGGDALAFAEFLLMALLFMFVYSILGFMSFIPTKFNFLIAFLVTLLAFINLDIETIQVIISNYEAMGITITVILPILILLAFTFRIYQRAYEGESETSPFYAEMFNLVFLIFFGIFFIRHSSSEEGAIKMMRFVSGGVLIFLGIAQLTMYKFFAEMFYKGKRDSEKLEKEMKDMKKEAVDKINEIQAGMDFSYSKGMRRGGKGKKNGGRFVKRASTERYARRFGDEAAKKRFGS
ncbi:MAG: hypothetical protein U9Q73_03350 [Nanoarchaeota archaeon]|nr:hypothetical protein [Nanoarchaeota archaeon]